MDHRPDPARLRARRQRLSDALGGAPILLMGHRPQPRNFLANVHPFRQDSTFLYFVGVDAPGAAAVIEGGRTTLYLPAPDPADALWHGEGPDLATWQARAGADDVQPIGALQPGPRHALPAAEPTANAEAARLSGQPLDAASGTGSAALRQAVVALRLCRDEAELASMRRAVAVTADAHRAGMAATAPGATEFDVEAAVEAVFAAAGMRPAYGSIVTVRGEVLHGHAEGAVLADGDLLLVDAGAEEPGGYASDVTRTWPVSGRFSPRQRAVYDAVLEANRVSTDLVRAGVRYRDVHLASSRVIAGFARDEGLLRGDVDGLVEQGAHATFFPHGVGHLLGLDVHDLELYGDAAGYAPGRARSSQFGLSYLRLDRDLEPGMVVTIEPGFYVVPAILRDGALRERLGGAVDWDRAASWIGFGGIRIEDDVAVTAGDPEILSEGIPRSADEVEGAVGR
jgi:Xaa-Pro aminopeptidase